MIRALARYAALYGALFGLSFIFWMVVDTERFVPPLPNTLATAAHLTAVTALGPVGWVDSAGLALMLGAGVVVGVLARRHALGRFVGNAAIVGWYAMGMLRCSLYVT